MSPSLPPLASLPEHASFPRPVSRPRRLVKRLPRPKNLEAERARRAVAMRTRKRRHQARMVALAILAPTAVVTSWLAVRAVAARPHWPSAGQTWTLGLSCAQAPVALGHSWYFASSSGSVWRVAANDSKPSKIWEGVLPASAQLTGISNGVFISSHGGSILRLDEQGHVRWRAKNAGAISSRPAVFLRPDASTLVGGDDTGHLWARDAQTGKFLWQKPLNAPIGEGATATPWGVVVPLLGSATMRGGLRCVSPTDGSTKWSFPANPRDRSAGTALARFDAATNRLFWCNDEGMVVALDARTGRKIWKAFAAPRGGSSDAVMLRASPVLVNGVLVVGGNDGALRAFDAATGRALWTNWTGQPLDSPLGKVRIEGKTVITAGNSPVLLVDPRTGARLSHLGNGQVAWNGKQFAASDDDGVWHRWTAS